MKKIKGAFLGMMVIGSAALGTATWSPAASADTPVPCQQEATLKARLAELYKEYNATTGSNPQQRAKRAELKQEIIQATAALQTAKYACVSAQISFTPLPWPSAMCNPSTIGEMCQSSSAQMVSIALAPGKATITYNQPQQIGKYPIANYMAQAYAGNYLINYAPWGDLPWGVNPASQETVTTLQPITLTGLTSGQTYTVTVFSTNTQTMGVASNFAAFTMP